MMKKTVKQNLNSSKEINLRVDDSKVAMIQMLIPLGLMAIEDLLLKEVEDLAGKRYKRNNSDLKRWGANPGSAYLGGQKVDIKVPRVRDVRISKEVNLQAYEQLQTPKKINETILANIIN